MTMDQPGTIDDHMAINIGKILNAAPTLQGMPDLVVAIAKAGGDVEENAQAVAGLHLMQTVTQAVHQHISDNQQHYDALHGYAKQLHDEVGG